MQTETLSVGNFAQAFTYSYDAKGNITNNGASAFLYDKIGRLIAETTLAGTTTAVTYDTCGNVLTKTGYSNGFTYGSFSRLTNYNGTAISYDYAGNPLNWVGITDMVYTRRNLLASANANGTAVSYAYDGEGRRIQKTVNGATQTFYYEGDRLAAWKNGYDTYYFLYDNSDVCGFYRNGQCYLFLKNMLGDVLALYLISGATTTLVARYEYDAWGVCTVKNPDGSLNASATFMGNINPFRYRGYFYDVELGLYWLKTRHYDPRVGRFLTKDSMDYYDHTAIDGLNLYAYCTNDPVNKCDPSGHFALSTFLITLAATSLISWAISEIVGEEVASGVSSVVNGSAAVATGIGLLSFGPVGWVAGGLLILTGATTASFGVNDVVSGITGTNYIQEWTGMSDGLYNGLNIGLNIASSVGTMAGNAYMTYNPKFPGNNPNRIPDGFSQRPNPKANYYNKKTGQSLHPDLQHPTPIGPHWDWKDSKGDWWRLYRFYRRRK